LHADLPVEDRLRSIVESRQVQEIALRAPAVDVLVTVDVDALAIPGGNQPEKLHDRAIALDVRLDPDLRSARPREHVQAPSLAVARRPERLDADAEHPRRRRTN